MPLPDAGADGPLDWAHLVDAAKAFEGRYTFCFQLLCHQILNSQSVFIFFSVWPKYTAVVEQGPLGHNTATPQFCFCYAHC